jgi:hypothetical protein
MRALGLAAGLLSLAAVPFAFAQADKAALHTTVVSEAAKAKLLGKHRLALQWISWTKFGEVTVAADANGVMTIKGEQRGAKGGADVLTVDGVITRVEDKAFQMNGTVVYHVADIANGRACERRGTLTFKITGKRRYWRMQEMQSPCDGVTDYVDVFFD